MKHVLAAVVGVACLGRGAVAEIRLPHLLSDHAVLQRDAPVHVWGWANPGASLTIHLHAQTVTAVADRLGKWNATLLPEPAGGPYTLTIDGDGHAELQDVMLGDVWFASGQSNMEMPLKGFGGTTVVKDSAREIAAANRPELRLLLAERKSADLPLDDLSGAWTRCTPETAANFSAVAYFFGREIAAREHVTVGLIDATWGGTPADAWVSMDTLGSDARLLPAFAARAEFAAQQADAAVQIAAEKREDAAAVAAGKPAPAHAWHPDAGSWNPAGLYNGMIAPATPYTLKGFLWYQGETNSGTGRAEFYRTLFPALIADWRMHFGQGDLPFVYAQISSFNSPAEHWGTVRDAQRRALALRNTAMAVTLDIGLAGNVHPPDKQTVGARLALGARAVAYGEAVAYQSPLLREVTMQTGALRVWFDGADGLTSRGKAVEGFEVAGADHRFVPATAEVEGTSVVVRSAQVETPRYARYLWQNVAPAPLYNGAGLPASTFSSEWFPVTER